MPISSHARGSNHVQLNPHRSRYQNTFATNAGPNPSQRQQRNCRHDRDCHDARTPHLWRCASLCVTPSVCWPRHQAVVYPGQATWPTGAASQSCQLSDRLTQFSARLNIGQSRPKSHGARCTRAVRSGRTSFPCASPASSSCWAGLQSACIM